jgi:hypothetical protein
MDKTRFEFMEISASKTFGNFGNSAGSKRLGFVERGAESANLRLRRLAFLHFSD